MKKTLLVLFLAGLGALCQLLPRAEAGIGVVTGIRGEATVRRGPAPQPQALKFKDELFWLDTLNTGADSRLRLFILEQSVITMKERSQLQLREEAVSSTQPKKKSVINLLSGSVRAVVEKEALKDTDYEIRTGRAIAGIRGSDVIAAVGTALNDRFRALGLPSISHPKLISDPNISNPNLIDDPNLCVAFVTGPRSQARVTDSKLGATDMDQLDLLTVCDQFTHHPISEEVFNNLANFLGGSADTGHTPGTGDGGGGGGGPPGGGDPYGPTQGIFPGGGKTGPPTGGK